MFSISLLEKNQTSITKKIRYQGNHLAIFGAASRPQSLPKKYIFSLLLMKIFLRNITMENVEKENGRILQNLKRQLSEKCQ